MADENALADTLDRTATLLRREAVADGSLLSHLDDLRVRLRHEQLQLAVVGQFKRGKSTFLNALLGASLLPMGIVPLTALPVFIAWAPHARVTVRFGSDRPAEECAAQEPDAIRSFLNRFVAEEANPENRLGVSRVDLLYPASILAGGTILIDTPGVGSTYLHNTEAAMRVLQECDAVLFVVSADPPITQVETDYLQHLKRRAARVFFILNKIDHLSAAEVEESRRFLDNVLLRIVGIDDPEIFPVSAKKALEAKRDADAEELALSGIRAVEERLVRFLAREKAQSLRAAVVIAAKSIMAQAEAGAELRAHVLRMPLDDLVSRSGALDTALQGIDDQRRVIRDLLDGEHRRLRDLLAEKTNALCDAVVAKLIPVIDRHLQGDRWTETGRKALASAIEAEFDAARDTFVAAFAAKTNEALAAHQSRIASLTGEVDRAASGLFDVALPARMVPAPFRLSIDPYWVTENIDATLIPSPAGLVDRVLPPAIRRKRVRSRLVADVSRLVLRNANNLNWAVLQSLADTFRRIAADFERQLDEALHGTRGIVQDAISRRQDRVLQIEPELAKLSGFKSELERLREALDDERSVGASPAVAARLHTG